jgi:outer membrane protein OmpA-like peptidoglycan-associated protein
MGASSVMGQIAEDSLQAQGLSWERRKVLRSGLGPEAMEALREHLTPHLLAAAWQEALEEMAFFEEKLGGQQEFQELKAILEAPEQGIVRKPVSSINTGSGLEYTPVLSADGRKLYFTAQRRAENRGGEDVFVVSRAGAEEAWGEVQLIESLSSAGRSESPLSLSADGNRMLLFLSGKITTADKTATGWAEPVTLGRNINAGRWQADAVLSADGQAMIFVAGPGPGWKQDQNIFVSEKLPDGSWGPPQSLGRSINTPASERSPFLHPDGRTLYFSSGGHGGMGKLDVFKTVRQGKSWTEWSKPVNLGKEINTPGNDWGYVISTDGKTAYFSAVAEEDHNIFELSLPEAVRPEPVTTITGKVKGLDPNTQARIRVDDALTQKKIGEFSTEPGTGTYFIVVPGGVKPLVSVEKDGVFSAPKLFDVTAKNEQGEIEEDLEVVDFDNEESEKKISLEDVLFETGKYAIGSGFYDDLDRLAELIKTRELSVRIVGHTDNVGEKASNQQLSENRAEAVRQYLISKGCDQQRIEAEGKGETQPRASNETSLGRKKNRRVELFFRQE